MNHRNTTPAPSPRESETARKRRNANAARLAASFEKRLDCGPNRGLRRAVRAMVREKGGAATLDAAESYFSGRGYMGERPTVRGLLAMLYEETYH